MVRDTLYLRSECKEDSLLAVIAHKEKQLSEQKTVTVTVEKPVPVKHTPRWVAVLAYVGVAAVIILVVYIYLNIKKRGVQGLLKRISGWFG